MIYTPDQLSLPEFDNPFPKFAVFGHPIAHSLSPKMQNAALAELAKTRREFAHSKYYAFDVEPQNLGAVLAEFIGRNFVGINLTIPHKEVVLPFLKSVDSFAMRAGACNTLVAESGGWRGFNTDGFGIEGAMEHAFGSGFGGADVFVLGAGGAARGACFYALERGCKSLSVANRSPERLARLVADIRAAGFECSTFELSRVLPIPENAVVVNATSIGLKPDDAPVLDFSAIPASVKFFDMPYRVGAETSSVLAARKCGIAASSGLPMLAFQGAKSMSIWTGADCRVLAKTMLEALCL